MNHKLNILLFTLTVTLFYAALGFWVPQKELHPPKELTLRDNLTDDEMVELGKRLVVGKGMCVACHTFTGKKGERFPDLGGIGLIAETRRKGMSGAEYLAESLLRPGAYIVSGYPPGMPPAHRAPAFLKEREILVIIAYLQSLGARVTVTMKTRFRFDKGPQQ